jgi:hypothetical protein
VAERTKFGLQTVKMKTSLAKESQNVELPSYLQKEDVKSSQNYILGIFTSVLALNDIS